MVASEHPEVIEGRRRLIATDVLESEEEADDGSIDNDGAALDEEYDSGSGETGVRTCVTKSETEEGGRYAEGYEIFLSFFLLLVSYFSQTDGMA